MGDNIVARKMEERFSPKICRRIAHILRCLSVAACLVGIWLLLTLSGDATIQLSRVLVRGVVAIAFISQCAYFVWDLDDLIDYFDQAEAE